MNDFPIASVIMPVYNAEKHVSYAIESILNQTFTLFEFIIYNDGSIDSTHSIIQKYKDDRIKYIKSEKNKGIVNALNQSISIAAGEYIIRMDSDDIADIRRIETQVLYMERNKKIGICGSYLRIMDSSQIVVKPITDSEIRWWFFKGCPFAHPSVIIRKSVLKENNLHYREEFKVAEDYDLWWRMAKVTRMSNISEKLLSYRVHLQQESNTNSLIQAEKVRKSKEAFFEYLKIDSSPENIKFAEEIFSDLLAYTPRNLLRINRFFKKLNSDKSKVFFGMEEIDNTRKYYVKKQLVNLEYYSISLILYPSIWLIKDWRQSILFLIKCIVGWKTRTK
jgi:glycosyltransferase involved in cell wall biosynthesis